MARSANGTLRVKCDISEVSTALGVGDATARLDHTIDFVYEMASGTADGQIDRVYSTAASLTTSPTDVDLVGSLTSVLSGAATSFVDLVGIVIQHYSGTGVVQIGADAAGIPIFGATNDLLNLYPGGIFVWFAPAGVATVATTGDILQLATASSTAVVKVIIFGRSA